LSLNHYALITALVQVDATFETSGLGGMTVTCDGASNVKREALLNVLVVNKMRPVHLDTMDTEGARKTGQFIATFLIETLKSRKIAERVYSCVMDSASNNKAAAKIIEREFPWITCCPCFTHIMDLFLKVST
jgi:GTP cyclohydrolase FolE2